MAKFIPDVLEIPLCPCSLYMQNDNNFSNTPAPGTVFVKFPTHGIYFLVKSRYLSWYTVISTRVEIGKTRNCVELWRHMWIWRHYQADCCENNQLIVISDCGTIGQSLVITGKLCEAFLFLLPNSFEFSSLALQIWKTHCKSLQGICNVPIGCCNIPMQKTSF